MCVTCGTGPRSSWLRGAFLRVAGGLVAQGAWRVAGGLTAVGFPPKRNREQEPLEGQQYRRSFEGEI